MPADDKPKLSALVVAHNEEKQLAQCLECLAFADELVVVLDKCTDGSDAIAALFTRISSKGRGISKATAATQVSIPARAIGFLKLSG